MVFLAGVSTVCESGHWTFSFESRVQMFILDSRCVIEAGGQLKILPHVKIFLGLGGTVTYKNFNTCLLFFFLNKRSTNAVVWLWFPLTFVSDV